MRSACLFVAVVATFLLAGHVRPREPYAGNIAPGEARAPADERKGFHMPPGFEVQLVAAEPDIHKPLNMAFDDRGRLWVTETVEYPFAAKDKPRDAVKVLEDFGPDGRARKITTFCSELNIPIGLLPLPATNPAEALVFSIPAIWHVQQGGARKMAYREYGQRDTHGLTSAFTWGFDGWVYACHGFSNDSTVRASDGSAVTMNSGNTYRFKADGSHVEAYARGQVNPFGLCFDPLGNLYSADCHSQPIYQLLRGAYYPSFGKPHDGLGYGPEMISRYDDSTAIAGCAYYAADHFPAAYRERAYIGDVVTNRIVQFNLTWNGSSPRAALAYFLKSDDPWFRPVDLKVGPDGALYVADFYNRIIGHYEVPLDHPGRDRERGRIWRIVWKGPDAGTPAPRGDWTKATPAELASDLGHPNLTVRMLATNELTARGGDGVKAVQAALAKTPTVWQRVHGLWILQRNGALDDDRLIRAAADPERAVRVHVQNVLAARERWSDSARKLALKGLQDGDPHVRRAAAAALGAHPAPANVRPLLDLRHVVSAGDTHLLHIVRMALRDQLTAATAFAELPRDGWSERDARAIADVSLGVPSAEAAAYLLEHFRKYGASGEPLVPGIHHIARHGKSDIAQGLLEFVLQSKPDDLGHQVVLFRALERGAQERGAELAPEARAGAERLAARLLASNDGGQLQAGIELVGALRLESQQALVSAVAKNVRAGEEQRVAALNALASLDARKHAATLGAVLTDAGAPIGLREQAANLLAQANQPETRAELVNALPTATARLQNAIAAGLAGSKAGAELLLEAVAAGKASARLLQERAVEVKLAASQVRELKARLAKLTTGLPPADEKLNDLLRKRREGYQAAKTDAALGRKVFEKSCANCHQIGGQGAKIGPQLDGIGTRGLDRLLEDTLDPNRNVDQAFRLTTLLLKKGQVVSGLLLKEEGAVLVLADAQGKEVRVEKNAVDERSTSQQSPMPANLVDQIPEADFYHLLAFLLEQRAAKP